MHDISRDWLRILYGEVAPIALAVAQRILRDRAEAEDVLQDAFVLALELRDRFDPRRGTRLAWVLSIVRTKALDKVRARNVRSRAVHLLEQHHEDSVLADCMATTRIAPAMKLLPLSQRTVLSLAYFEGLTHSEIAAKLDAPLGSVKTWLRAAVLQLATACDPAQPADLQ